MNNEIENTIQTDSNENELIVSREDKIIEKNKDITELIKLDEHGIIKPSTLSELISLSKLYMSSGIVPKTLDTAQKVFIALQYGSEKGLSHQETLRRTYVVNGSPQFYAEMPLNLCRRTGLLIKMTEYLIDSDYKKICISNENLDAEIFAAICIGWRKGEDEPYESHFTKEDAIRAGLWKNTNKLYGKYPKDMMKYRARTRMLMDCIPEAMAGVDVYEYSGNIRDVTVNTELNKPISKANEINKELEGQ